jgi:hypothetical protein
MMMYGELEVDFRSDSSSTSCSWEAASSSYENGVETDSTWERASTTTLCCPVICLISVVNWAMKSRWRNCRGEHLSLF